MGLWGPAAGGRPVPPPLDGELAVASHWVVMSFKKVVDPYGGNPDVMKRCAYCNNADVEFWGRCPSCGKARTSATVKISIIVGVVAIFLLLWDLHESDILPAWVWEDSGY